MAGIQQRFGLWDWIVFSALLAISIGIGLYYAISGGKQKTTKEFLSGDRNMKVIPIAISILVSFQSAILIIGTPAEMYTVDTQFYINTFGGVFGCILATLLFVPLFYSLKTVSVYEYLELRFKSRATRVIGSTISILSTLIFTGFVSFAPATALLAVSGFPEWASYLIMGTICTVYTFLGGLKAVVWVDAFQGFIMLAGILAIIIQGVLLVGGVGEVWQISEEWGRINFWNFDPDPTIRHTFWALVIGGTITSTGIYGTTQSSVQRYTALPTLFDAKLAIMFNGVASTIFATLACFSGLVVFSYYASIGCDPLSSGDVTNPNQLIPYYITDVLGFPGVPGLFISALYSGSLSTISSNLNALCAQTWEDILKPFLDHKSEPVKAWIARITVLVYGALGIGITFLVSNIKGTVLQAVISFSAAGGGPLTGIIVLGAFFPWANWIGAIVGSVVSYAIIMWLNIAQYSVIGGPPNSRYPTANCSSADIYNSSLSSTISSTISTTSLFTTTNITLPTTTQTSGLTRYYSLSYLWYLAYGVLIVLIVGLPVSFITGPMKKEDVDSKYIIPLFDHLCCCLPVKVRKKLQCGYSSKSTDSKEQEFDMDSPKRNDQGNINTDVINDNLTNEILTKHQQISTLFSTRL